MHPDFGLLTEWTKNPAFWLNFWLFLAIKGLLAIFRENFEILGQNVQFFGRNVQFFGPK